MSDAILAAVVAASVSVLVSGLGVWYQEVKYRRRSRGELAVRSLLTARGWKLRSFENIKAKLGGYDDDELRRLLVRSGAVQFRRRSDPAEMWGLLDKNKTRVSGKAGSMPVNYPVGFQRGYAVLAGGWIIATVLMLPTDRVKFWAVPAISRQAEDTIRQGLHDGYTADEIRQKMQEAGWSPEAIEVQLSPFGYAKPLPSRREKIVRLLSVLILPPLIGYVLLFYIFPWVHRGFQS